MPAQCLKDVSMAPCLCQHYRHTVELSPIHKFNYLKAQLQGDAARAIAGLPLTEMNYAQSVTLLKQPFGQPEKLTMPTHRTTRTNK